MTSCSGEEQPPKTTRTVFAMDTTVTVTIFGNSDIAEAALDSAIERLYELEKIFSYTDPDSELSYINANAYGQEVEVGEDMHRMIDGGLFYSKITRGAFDITLGKLIEQGNADEFLPYLGWENVEYDHIDNTVQFTNEHIKLHFGAIAKGYAATAIAIIFYHENIKSAIIDLGGDIYVYGDSPREDNMWSVAIADPFNPSKHAAIISVPPDTAVMTSGTYERGEHIYDRRTGLPADSEFASVTVISKSGTMSDALSTAIFVNNDFVETEMNYFGFCIIAICKKGKVTDYHFGFCYCGNLDILIDSVDSDKWVCFR